MSRRNNFNVKDKIRSAEDDIDSQLKDAGLWEEGLSNVEKQQLLDCIADSRNLAQVEETRRKGWISEHKNSIVGNSKTTKKTSKTSSPVEEDADGEPIITFESPSKPTAQHQTSLIGKETSSKKNLNAESSFKEKEEILCTKDSDISKDGSTIKQINSLLSNTSITIRYSSSPKTKNSESSCGIIVSETDDESTDENMDQLFIKDKISNTTQNLRNKQNNLQKKSYEVVDLDNNSSLTNKTPLLEKNMSLNENQCSKTNNGPKPSEVKENEMSSEPLSHNISDIDSPEVLVEKNKTCLNIRSESNNNNSNYVNNTTNNNRKKIVFNPFYANSKSDNPLKQKFNLTEKQEEAYFKSTCESESECVKRIYSLITDWRVVLAKYQRTLVIPSKWGLPINVDRQIQDGLIKKSYANQLLKSKHLVSAVYTSDISSGSESHISDHSDEEWEIFPKKKRWKATKKYMKRNTRLNRECKSTNLKGSSLPSEKEEKSDSGALSKNVVMETSEYQNEELPSCSGVSISNFDKNLINDPISNDVNSQSVLNNSSNPISKVQTTFYSMNSNRQNQLSDSRKCPININSESPELFDSQPTKEFLSQNSDANINILESGSSAVTSQISDSMEETSSQGSVKRKFIPNPINMPPLKKAFRDQDIDVIEEFKDNKKISDTKLATESPKLPLQETINDPSTKSSKEQKSLENKEEIFYRNDDCSSNPTLLKPENVNKVEGIATTSKVKTIECPLCQKDYLLEEIEAHASECNGMEETAELKNQRVVPGRRRPPMSQLEHQNQQPKKSQQQTRDIEYLETHRKGLNSVSRRGK